VNIGDLADDGFLDDGDDPRVEQVGDVGERVFKRFVVAVEMPASLKKIRRQINYCLTGSLKAV